jgi:hypothetical protein
MDTYLEDTELPIENKNLPADHQDAGEEKVKTINFGGHSPLPNVRKAPETPPTLGFDFYEAIKQMMIGRRVTRMEWDDEGYFGEFRDGKLMIHKPEENGSKEGYHDWIISDGDIMGVDWVTL